MATQKNTDNPLMALIDAVHEVRPPVFADGMKICTDPREVSSVTITFSLSPELVAAWGKKCAGQ